MDVSADVGGGCRGYATAAPDLELVDTGAGQLLRIFFVPVNPGEDTTLIINGPDGQWYCSDDAYGVNPSVDFDSGPSGTYDIWVGSFTRDEYVSGTLYLTEFSTTTPDTV